MAARRGQKLKLFYIVEILKKYSDENHPLNATEICNRLEMYDVTAERKAIYDDIECLTLYGYDIIKTRVPKNGFFLGARDFELPEIYLLGDAVRTAKFISAKKTRELTAKLNGMLSNYERSAREKGIYINSIGKTKNEEIFYNIDALSEAIKNGHKVALKYGSRTLCEDREIKINYKERIISPYAMTWQDDHYYLIGNYEKYDNLLHLRIDRMRAVSELDEKARPFYQVSDYTDCFDVADYTSKLFGMHGGEECDVELRCSKSMLEQVADRFGENIFIRNLTDTHFSFTVTAAVSQALVTWIMNYGDKIEVLAPDSLRDMVKQRAKKIYSIYK